MQSSIPKTTRIIGAGLAGSEAAWQLAQRGFPVKLFEMRPSLMTKAHKTGQCAELVCSNSLRGKSLTNGVGLLKEELRLLGSLILEAADATEVPAGGALAVDRVRFSSYIDEKLRTHPLISIEDCEVQAIPTGEPAAPVIVASGPLTSPALSQSIQALTGHEHLAFFDAISPIILRESMDETKMFRQSRYDKGSGDDYLNIALDREQYYTFVSAVETGEKFGGHEEVEADSIQYLRPFEGCMPIEEMVARGPETLRFGPFKPIGLRDPKSGARPYAVVQLRADDREGYLWSMVGMQTRLKHGEQLRIFRSLPGLEQAEFVRLGTVHRNSFIESPKFLDPTLRFRTQPALFFAGQITGVEGYVESTAGGLVAGINASRLIGGQDLVEFPGDTAIGALMNYISNPERKLFQPMNISFGLMPSYLSSVGGKRTRGGPTKDDRRLAASETALQLIRELAAQVNPPDFQHPAPSSAVSFASPL